MTLAEYQASRPDLINNWNAANNMFSGFYDTDVARYIRNTFKSHVEYLRADYGRDFDPPSSYRAPVPPAGGYVIAQIPVGDYGASNAVAIAAPDASDAIKAAVAAANNQSAILGGLGGLAAYQLQDIITATLNAPLPVQTLPPPVTASSYSPVSNNEPENYEIADEPEPQAPPVNFNLQPVKGDNSHVYVGTDWRGDVWQLFDGSNVIEWAVKQGTDSRAVLGGTLVNLGPPSAMSVAQAPTAPAVAPASGPEAVTDAIQNAPQTPIASNPDWKNLKPANDVNNTLPYDVNYIAPDDNLAINRNPNLPTVNETPLTGSGGGGVSGAAGGTNISATGENAVPFTPPDLQAFSDSRPDFLANWVRANNAEWYNTEIGAYIRNFGTFAAYLRHEYNLEPNVIAANNSPAQNAAAEATPQKSDPRHVYVGRDTRGDVWQIFDGTDVIEWAVRPGDQSANVISDTLRNIGPPSSASVAQAGTVLPAPTAAPSNNVTTAPVGSGIGVVTVFGVLLSLLK